MKYIDRLMELEKQRRAERHRLKEALRTAGVLLSVEQATVLLLLGDKPTTASDVEHASQNLTYNLKRLARFGYIEQNRRPEHDRRFCLIEKTPMGEKLCKELEEILDESTTSLEATS